MPSGVGIAYGNILVREGVWERLEVDQPVLVRVALPSVTAPILYFPGQQPQDATMAQRAVNGDCLLSSPGVWFIRVGGAVVTGVFFTARIFPLEGSLYGDIGRNGFNRVSHSIVTLTAGVDAVIVPANEFRKYLLIEYVQGAVQAAIKVGSAITNFALGTCEGIRLTGVGASIIFADSSHTTLEIHAAGIGGAPDLVILEGSN
jgi:hypothetical protein